MSVLEVRRGGNTAGGIHRGGVCSRSEARVKLARMAGIVAEKSIL